MQTIGRFFYFENETKSLSFKPLCTAEVIFVAKKSLILFSLQPSIEYPKSIFSFMGLKKVCQSNFSLYVITFLYFDNVCLIALEEVFKLHRAVI